MKPRDAPGTGTRRPSVGHVSNLRARADFEHLGAADGALAFGRRATVFHLDLLVFGHLALRFTLDAVGGG